VGLMDGFRRAEEQARKAARAGTERAIAELEDAERAIRRRMRIYPKQVRAIPTRITSATAARLRPFEPPLEDPPKAS
jgi:hypothetical protein